MKYTVDVKDTSYATIVVDAPSREAAEEIAMAKYYEGSIEWADCDIEIEAREREKERSGR